MMATPDTYSITDPSDTIWGDPIGFVTDALTGITTAFCPGDRKIELCVPLCMSCDAHVAGDRCMDCDPDGEGLIEPFANPFPEMTAFLRAEAERDARWAAEEADERRAA